MPMQNQTTEIPDILLTKHPHAQFPKILSRLDSTLQKDSSDRLEVQQSYQPIKFTNDDIKCQLMCLDMVDRLVGPEPTPKISLFDTFKFSESSLYLARVASLKKFQKDLIRNERKPQNDNENDLITQWTSAQSKLAKSLK